ncbi:hypothetical protein BHM03_00050053 [Ensete ventricosum]|nr:hypothetical protein BHM03_00050053 [Ensete ventricosum]
MSGALTAQTRLSGGVRGHSTEKYHIDNPSHFDKHIQGRLKRAQITDGPFVAISATQTIHQNEASVKTLEASYPGKSPRSNRRSLLGINALIVKHRQLAHTYSRVHLKCCRHPGEKFPRRSTIEGDSSGGVAERWPRLMWEKMLKQGRDKRRKRVAATTTRAVIVEDDDSVGCWWLMEVEEGVATVMIEEEGSSVGSER